MYKYKFNSIFLNLIIVLCIFLSGCNKPEYININPSTEENIDLDYEPVEEKKIIYVHICGFIRKPDVYELKQGARVKELLDLSGGFLEDADTEYINLARELIDGEKIYIPKKGEVINSLEAEKGTDKINLNTASKSELMTLRGIGENKANDIIRYRESNGLFKSIEDIMKVSGIKQSGFDKIKDKIYVN